MFQAKYLPGYKQKYKHLKPDAVPTIFADSAPPKRRLHTEKRIAKKERKELVAKLIEEYDKEKAAKEREKEAKNPANDSGTTKASQADVDNVDGDDAQIGHTEVAGAAPNESHDVPSVYIDKAEPYSVDITATQTNYTGSLAGIGTSSNIFPSFDADSNVTSFDTGLATSVPCLDFGQTSTVTATTDYNGYLADQVDQGLCANVGPVPFTATTTIPSDQAQLESDQFVVSSPANTVCPNSALECVSAGCESAVCPMHPVSTESESMIRPGRIDRTDLHTLPSFTPSAVNSMISKIKVPSSYVTRMRNKKRKLIEEPEPKFKEIGIQVSVEMCDKSVECDIPLDHTNSASCANCFARENPALAMSGHKYSFRTDSEGKRVSKSNKPLKKKGSALAAIIKRLSNIDQRESEAPINEIDEPEIEIETVIDDVCDVPIENIPVVEDEKVNLTKLVEENSSTIVNESPVDASLLRTLLEDKVSPQDHKVSAVVKNPSSPYTKPLLDAEKSNNDDTVQSLKQCGLDVENVCTDSPLEMVDISIMESVYNSMKMAYSSIEKDDSNEQTTLSGKTASDVKISVGDSETYANVTQTCKEIHKNRPNTLEDSSPDSLSRVETKTTDNQPDGSQNDSEVVVCDEVPMEDCVVEINETLGDASPLASLETLTMNVSNDDTDTRTIGEPITLSDSSDKQVPQRKFKKTIIPRMLHKYGTKSSGPGEHLFGNVINAKPKPLHSGISNAHGKTSRLKDSVDRTGPDTYDMLPLPHLTKSQAWQPVSQTKRLETQDLSKPWQPWTLQNSDAKPSVPKKAKPHFSEILKEFKASLDNIDTDVGETYGVGLDNTKNESVTSVPSMFR